MWRRSCGNLRSTRSPSIGLEMGLFEMPVQIIFEVWESEEEGSISLFDEDNSSARSMLEPDAKHIYSIRAATYEEAMQAHYDACDYGTYIPIGGLK